MSTMRPRLPVIDYSALPDPRWSQEQVSDTRNAAGAKPYPLMYLWIFERPDSLCAQLVSHGWVCLGPLHLLVSPDARVNDPIMRSKRDIEQTVKGFSTAAGRYSCPRFIDFEKFHSYFGYPINYLWCQNDVWQDAFRRVADRCTRFVVDLTTDERPTGLLFELTHLFNRVSAENIILLIDRSRADLDVIGDFVLGTWSSMAESSINRGPDTPPPPLISYKTTSLRYLAQAARGQWTGKCAVPLARRAAHHAGWD